MNPAGDGLEYSQRKVVPDRLLPRYLRGPCNKAVNVLSIARKVNHVFRDAFVTPYGAPAPAAHVRVVHVRARCPVGYFTVGAPWFSVASENKRRIHHFLFRGRFGHRDAKREPDTVDHRWPENQG